MSIKIATIEDLDLVLEMGHKFLETTNYVSMSDPSVVRNLAVSILSSPKNKAICLIHEDGGMIVGVINPFIFGTQTIATEIAWWVEPSKRGLRIGEELINTFEYWAIANGCKGITLVSLDDSLSKYYEKRGYSLYERAYKKELN